MRRGFRPQRRTHFFRMLIPIVAAGTVCGALSQQYLTSLAASFNSSPHVAARGPQLNASDLYPPPTAPPPIEKTVTVQAPIIWVHAPSASQSSGGWSPGSTDTPQPSWGGDGGGGDD